MKNMRPRAETFGCRSVGMSEAEGCAFEEVCCRSSGDIHTFGGLKMENAVSAGNYICTHNAYSSATCRVCADKSRYAEEPQEASKYLLIQIFMATTSCNIYTEASAILLTHRSGSLKSRIYSTHNAPQKPRCAPARLYALIMESLKYQDVLNEVIKNSGILTAERKVSIGIYCRLALNGRC